MGQSIALLYQVTECCMQEKEQEKMSKPAAFVNEWCTETHFQFQFYMPHLVSISCQFAVWFILQAYQIFSALSDLKQQGYGLNHIGFLN